MAAVWAYLEKEYRKLDLLLRQLGSFQICENALMDAAKFKEQYQIWREVVTDLKKIKLEGGLDNSHALMMFQSKMLQLYIVKSIDFKQSSAIEGKTLCTVMDTFMNGERDQLREIEQFQNSV